MRAEDSRISPKGHTCVRDESTNKPLMVSEHPEGPNMSSAPLPQASLSLNGLQREH